MKPHLLATSAIVAFTISGCASNEPSPAMREWARQQIAEKQRVEAAQTAHAQELAQLKAENERIKAQADAAKLQLQVKTYVEENKSVIIKELTQGFYPHRQEVVANYFKGTCVHYEIDDVTFRDSILYFSQFMIWQKPDGTGATGRVVFGYDPVAEKFVYDRASNPQDLSAQDWAGILKEINPAAGALVQPPSVWAPDKEVVNTAYKAVITAGVAVLADVIKDAVSQK